MAARMDKGPGVRLMAFSPHGGLRELRIWSHKTAAYSPLMYTKYGCRIMGGLHRARSETFLNFLIPMLLVVNAILFKAGPWHILTVRISNYTWGCVPVGDVLPVGCSNPAPLQQRTIITGPCSTLLRVFQRRDSIIALFLCPEGIFQQKCPMLLHSTLLGSFLTEISIFSQL